MSWLDQIKNDLIITCGDNKEYRPSWINASFEQQYNTAEFDYPDLPGTKVDRRQRRGRRFNLEIYFQGDDHLDVSNKFWNSCNDRRAWTLQHPFYSTLIVQPLSLSFDNTDLNVTKITGIIVETITDDNPKINQSADDQVPILKEILDANMELALVEFPTPSDVNMMSQKNNDLFAKGVPIIKLPEEFEEYNNVFNQANTFINTATATPLLAMRATVAMISKPAQFTLSVQQRMDVLSSQFDTLRNNLLNITRVSAKQIYQIHAGTIVSSMCLAAVTPLAGNYTNVNNVLGIVNRIVATYRQYVEDLDTLQGLNGGNPANFIPSADAITQLNYLYNLTISNLFDIALNSKQERSVILDRDTNLILLTHRFYGLDNDDNNINEMIINNNFGLDHYLVIKKGTKVIYYI